MTGAERRARAGGRRCRDRRRQAAPRWRGWRGSSASASLEPALRQQQVAELVVGRRRARAARRGGSAPRRRAAASSAVRLAGARALQLACRRARACARASSISIAACAGAAAGSRGRARRGRGGGPRPRPAGRPRCRRGRPSCRDSATALLGERGRARQRAVEQRLVAGKLVARQRQAAVIGERERQQGGDDGIAADAQLPRAGLPGVAVDLVQAEPEQPRHHLVDGEVLAVALDAGIGHAPARAGHRAPAAGVPARA